LLSFVYKSIAKKKHIIPYLPNGHNINIAARWWWWSMKERVGESPNGPESNCRV
jgi:hypothetical protein